LEQQLQFGYRHIKHFTTFWAPTLITNNGADRGVGRVVRPHRAPESNGRKNSYFKWGGTELVF